MMMMRFSPTSVEDLGWTYIDRLQMLSHQIGKTIKLNTFER